MFFSIEFALPYSLTRVLQFVRASSTGGAGQWAAAILCLGTIAAAILFVAAKRHYDAQRQASQQITFRNLLEDIDSRFKLYAYGLRAVRNFAGVETLPALTRANFERFVGSNFQSESPGARGIGVIRVVRPEEEAGFLLERRRIDDTDFHIRQIVPHDGTRFVIQYVTPREGNKEAIGLDINSEAIRRDAALAAVDRNDVTLTAPIQLVQAAGTSKHGLLSLLPIYEYGRPLATPEQRFAALGGWVYSPLVIDDVLADIVTRYNRWRFRIADVAAPVPDALYDTINEAQGAQPLFQDTISIQGRQWRIAAFREQAASGPGSHEHYIAALMTFLLFVLMAIVAFYRVRHHAKEQHLLIERWRFADIVAHASDAMLSTDTDGRIVSWNAAACRLFQITDGDAEGRDVRTFLTAEPGPIFEDLNAGLELPDGGVTVKTVCKRSDGQMFPALISFFALRNDARQLGISVRDMSDQQAFEDCILKLTYKLQAEVKERTTQLEQSLALQAEIHHLAMHDPLTGLANRTLFRDRLLAAVAVHAADPSQGFVLLALDLDQFKPVNDTYGHPIGDLLLAQIGARLRRCIGEDELAARLGGDEFAILLRAGTSGDESIAVVKRISASIQVPFEVEGLHLEIGVSIGIAVHDETMRGIGADDIFKLADHALYDAKRNGRGGYHQCTDPQEAQGPHTSRLAIEMRDALRREEFHLQYQPIIDCATGQLDGFEALLRWRHPMRGPISPVEFIAVAEESDQIVALGEWALRTACKEATRWGNETNISVNVSPLQIKRAGWDDNVIAAVEECGLSPSRLIIEVTESVLMADSDQVLHRLKRLQDYGISIALDDFGTGYSSLSYLRKFRFNKLKIDKSFMRDSEDVMCAAIIRCIVRLGRQLSVQVVAEGIETEKQMRLIEREGCSFAQGYFFSKPIDPTEARAYIAQVRSRESALPLFDAPTPEWKTA